MNLLWCVRRELWENRSLYLGPIAVAAVFLIGFFVSLGLGGEIVVGSRDPYMYAALVIMATGVGVGIFYCLDALYGERRDRSILFWKSLPVSDTTTVLSKAAIAFVVLPVITIAATIVVHLVMLIVSSIIVVTRGGDAGALWRIVSPLDLAMRLTYHIWSIHVLWYAPFFTWLLLASAWARRAPFIWAGVPIVAAIVIEQLVLGTTTFLDAVRFRAMGGPDMLLGDSDMLGHVNPMTFFLNPGLWVGLGIAVLFLAAAVRLRRSNGPA